MRALQRSMGLIPAVLLAVTVGTTIGSEAQNPAAFTSDIRPIMERSCWDCHGEEFQRSGLDLRTRDDAILGGRSGPAFVPGRADESLFYRMIAVRFVQLFQGGLGNQNTDTWDAHSNLVENHTQHAAESDLPIAGLLTDLKARGLLDTTLIVWHAEFGRMPISQRGVGRDHNPGAMTAWMAGAGIRGGQVIGATDDFGYKALEQPISAHDLHATMLHLLGMDHTELTYRFSGRDMRLTDVAGTLIPQIVG